MITTFPCSAGRSIVSNSPSIEAHLSVIEQELNSHEFAVERFLLLATDELTQQVWTTLPVDWAVAIQAPTSSSIVILEETQAQQHSSEEALWQHMVAHNDLIRVVPANLSGITNSPPFPPLAPTRGALPAWLLSHVQQLSVDAAQSPVDETALKAGLFQVHDELHTSHSYSQSIEGEGVHAAGDYWHAIMHRREPDYGNSKYWFRRVGEHPIFHALSTHAAKILEATNDPAALTWSEKLCGGGWDPFAFVDLVQTLGRDASTILATAARRIQWVEMQLLLIQTYHDAVGES